MSLNNTSPPLPVAVSVPIGTAFTVSSVGVKRVNATKSSEQTPVVYQASKLSVASGAVTQNSALFVQVGHTLLCGCVYCCPYLCKS